MFDISKQLYKQAEKNVLQYRGSYDAPGFDACVKAEYKELVEQTIDLLKMEKRKWNLST